MTAKVPNLKKLRNQVDSFESKLNSRLSVTPLKISDLDDELHSALKTKSKLTPSKSYDKELLLKAKQEIELIDRELQRSSSPDDLCISSESENSKLSSSFRLTKSSALAHLKQSSSKSKPSDKELIKKLEAIIREKDKRIFILEEKLEEKHKVAETSMKKLSQTSKLIKTNEKDITKYSLFSFKKECELKLDDYKRMIARLEEENKELVLRLKSMENQEDESNEKHKALKGKLKSLEELKRQNQELKRKFDDSLKLVENLQIRYENLVESSMTFEEKTRELYRANQVLQENILKLLPES